MSDSIPYQKDTSTKLIEFKIPADSLEIGMHVTRLDRPWTDVPVLLQGLTIESIDDIELLRQHCVYVYVEIEEEFWLERSKSFSGAEDKPAYPGFREQVDIHEELPKAKIIMDEAQGHIEEGLDNISSGESFDFEASRKAIKGCVNSILSNANAMLWLSKLKNQDNYTSEHSLRVGILSIAFGRFMGLKSFQLELLGLCGMLHDVGKMDIPQEILNKPGRLNRAEYEIMKEHAAKGKAILESWTGVDQLIKDTAHYHHERIDGKGYPEQVNAQFLHKYIRMVSIVDVYDAITSSRPYKDGAPAFDALKILFAERDKHFDSELVEAFIRMIGIYPPGTLVEMSNGEVGIVVSANPDSRLRPKVELVADADKCKKPSYIVDLSANICDARGEPYAIKQGVANGSFGIDVKDYIMK